MTTDTASSTPEGSTTQASATRKVIEYVLVSADGVYEDPVGMMRVGEYQDEAYLRDGLGLLTACDAILFGRHTYEAFAKLYGSGTHKPMWADRLNTIPKYVFSSTLEHADWGNTTIVRGDVVAEVTRLRQQAGGNLLILGHGRLGETLLRERLIDVIDMTVYPLLLGRGKQYFQEGQHAKLKLTAVKTFSKVVKLTYETTS
ncbi:dihydrofolate reductase [Nocardia sp. GAS34]|uniref:dihydrofolate reductase family protein n=1 Tax=unclassified Nocardia TaxID=2637762 RepID=UPI003D202DD7